MNDVILTTMIIIIILIFIASGIWLFFHEKNAHIIWPTRGKMIFDLDPITRKVIPYSSTNYSETTIVSLSNNRHSKMHVNNMMKLFNFMIQNNEGAKIYRDALHRIGNGEENLTYEFVAQKIYH